MNTSSFVWLLSHDEVNQHLAGDYGAAHDLIVQPRWLKNGLPHGDCQALVVDLDSLAPGRLALQRLIKELSGPSHPYPVAVFGYSLEDDQILDLRAAGIHVFQHGLCPAVFATIAMNMHRFVWLLSHDEQNQILAADLGAARGLIVQPLRLKEGLPDGDCRALVVDLDSVAPGPLALQRLLKELSGRSHPYPVAAFGYSLNDDQVPQFRAAGIHVFQHCLCPEVFAAIAD
jgi:hypothetical protein